MSQQLPVTGSGFAGLLPPQVEGFVEAEICACNPLPSNRLKNGVKPPAEMAFPAEFVPPPERISLQKNVCSGGDGKVEQLYVVVVSEVSGEAEIAGRGGLGSKKQKNQR